MFIFRASLVLLLAMVGAASAEPIVGLYPGGSPWARVAEADRVRDALEPVGVRIGYLGDFLDIERPDELATIRLSLDAAWETGAVYVLNLMTTTALRPLAWPANAAEWARSNHYYALAFIIKAWGEACGPECYMLLIPYPEMNGNWVPYGEQPGDFIEAFGKLRYVLWQTGALPWVRMVWGPSVAGDVAGMAPYYPGAAWTDLVGCSAYADLALVTRCFDYLRTIAPGTPMLLAQTGACRPGNSAWARDLVRDLRAQPDVLGALWFDYDKECDWRLSPAGWREAVQILDPRRGR